MKVTLASQSSEKVAKFAPKDTFFVFMGHEYLYLDYDKDTWALGDVQQVDGMSTFTMPENAAIVKIDPE